MPLPGLGHHHLPLVVVELADDTFFTLGSPAVAAAATAVAASTAPAATPAGDGDASSDEDDMPPLIYPSSGSDSDGDEAVGNPVVAATAVGAAVSNAAGIAVGTAVDTGAAGTAVGTAADTAVGIAVSIAVGATVGTAIGTPVGTGGGTNAPAWTVAEVLPGNAHWPDDMFAQDHANAYNVPTQGELARVFSMMSFSGSPGPDDLRAAFLRMHPPSPPPPSPPPPSPCKA